MSTLMWIIVGGLLMSAIALVGSLTALMSKAALDRLVLPMVSLAAGTLLGGAFFHLIPEGFSQLGPLSGAFWVMGGFASFLFLEQFLHWHHCHRESIECRKPMTYLILIGDGVHNFLGGLSIAGAFLIDHKLGMTAWLAAVAHEIPQELGDFGVLIHGGWNRGQALKWNLISGLAFLAGALLTWLISFRFDVVPLLLLGAGNFIYIAASDLVPEIKSHEKLSEALIHFIAFVAGVLLLAIPAVALS